IVSKARLDLPEPDRPVITISELRGSLRWRSLRLCSRAPETTISPLWLTRINECRAGPGSNLCSHAPELAFPGVRRIMMPLLAAFFALAGCGGDKQEQRITRGEPDPEHV